MLKKYSLSLLAAAVVFIGLSACSKTETNEAPKPTASAEQAAPASAEQAAAASTDNKLPAGCEEYFSKVEAFISKYPQVAETYKQQMDQARQQWSTITDKAQLEQACQQASTQFESVIKSMPKQ